jgi:cob(I)alamin adenosyltransferase
VHPGRADPQYPPLRVTPEYTERLEQACDTGTPAREALSFILPGGTPAAALLHVARTVAARAERSVWALLDGPAGHHEQRAGALPQPAVGPAVHPARVANPGGDVMWKPGGER